MNAVLFRDSVVNCVCVCVSLGNVSKWRSIEGIISTVIHLCQRNSPRMEESDSEVQLNARNAGTLLYFRFTPIWLRPTKSGPVGLKQLTFHTFHHVQYNGCFKHMNYRLCMSNKPCHTIFFSFRMVGLQSWVLRVTKSSRFLRYPQDTSHFLCFYHVQSNTYNLL